MGEDSAKARPLVSVTHDVTTAFGDVVRSEVRLATVEMKNAAEQIRHGLVRTAVFAVLAALGLLPLLAACVIGLGNLMGQHYGWSALIVAFVCFAVGGGLAYRMSRKIELSRLSLPLTRDTLAWRRNGYK